ncbi:uncharacterized protein F4812DRAFT_421037, partial [Daldinia caldariorum]|uniref:uncharacterized protein n=1 Tax=Daldinia caldariorum TaxID=326644 RepID=UPI0020075E98
METKPMEFLRRVSDYSKRDIGFENNYLNGILGIFGYWAKHKNPVFHLSGVLIFLQQCEVDEGVGHVVKTYTDILMTGMTWTVKRGKQRRNTRFV